MNKSTWILAAAAVAMFADMPVAEALTTCQQMGFCPPGGGDPGGGGPVGVPEPASLALLGAGLSALGASLYRRSKRDRQ